jgi:glycosyltransferase involved in cell wall biosynthesis
MDEDSFGYPTLEAAHSCKPSLTAIDSGGVLEFVEDGCNGHVCQPDPVDLADKMDQLYMDKAKTKNMGIEAREKIGELQISWTHVLEKLLK